MTDCDLGTRTEVTRNNMYQPESGYMNFCSYITEQNKAINQGGFQMYQWEHPAGNPL